jgi:hypothetical protein
MTPLSQLVCPSNFWQGHIGPVPCITAAGKDITVTQYSSCDSPPQHRLSWLLAMSSLTKEMRLWDPTLLIKGTAVEN